MLFGGDIGYRHIGRPAFRSLRCICDGSYRPFCYIDVLLTDSTYLRIATVLIIGKSRSQMFSRLEYVYCSTDCVRKHQRELMAAAAMARFG